MNQNYKLPKKKIGNIFTVLGIIFFPLFASLYIVSLNSSDLISEVLALPILVLACLSFVLLEKIL